MWVFYPYPLRFFFLAFFRPTNKKRIKHNQYTQIEMQPPNLSSGKWRIENMHVYMRTVCCVYYQRVPPPFEIECVRRSVPPRRARRPFRYSYPWHERHDTSAETRLTLPETCPCGPRGGDRSVLVRGLVRGLEACSQAGSEVIRGGLLEAAQLGRGPVKRDA